MNKRRFRNVAMWVSVASAVILLLQLIGTITHLYTITDETAQAVVAAVNVFLGILTTLGILSNPTKPDSSGYNL
ncbi:phage holin [Paenibacillus sp. FSL R5-0407]|uniref:phage holin n=1 Tax=Paenibacillus sp. FSL R5-0407 TaxID=2975320 RepID=UPI0030FB87EB